jgi:NADPH:quinone reductase-like Zn-dependent oxidoreductase
MGRGHPADDLKRNTRKPKRRPHDCGDGIVMRQYGGPDVLRVEKATLTAVQPGEVRIRTIASAVNHSDLEIRAGNRPILKPEPFPYTPGLEAVGQVGADWS